LSAVTHILSVPLEPLDAPAPEKLRAALDVLCAKDPTLGIEAGPAGEIILKGITESQLEWVVWHLQREPGLAFKSGAPEVQYRETITRPVDWTYTHKQRDPSQYAKVRLHFIAQSPGAGIETEIRCRPEDLPPHIPAADFQDAIDRGILAACKAGGIAGFPVTDLKAQVVETGWHDVDSTQAAFEIAARLCLREALPKAQPCLLEPVMLVMTLTPAEFLGDVIGDFNARRGAVQSLAEHGATCAVTAMAPLANLLGYENALRSITRHRGTCTMAFDRYDRAPPTGSGDGKFRAAGAMRA
jgi:elongation factor G